MKENISKNIIVAAQNTSVYKFGAFTGEISPLHIKDLGLKWAILGHSERRTLFHEDSVLVAKKVKFALDCGLSVIACIGETLKERESGNTIKVIKS